MCMSPDYRTSISDSSFLATLQWSDAIETEMRVVEERELFLEALTIGLLSANA